jgi:hypothetical protein
LRALFSFQFVSSFDRLAFSRQEALVVALDGFVLGVSTRESKLSKPHRARLLGEYSLCRPQLLGQLLGLQLQAARVGTTARQVCGPIQRTRARTRTERRRTATGVLRGGCLRRLVGSLGICQLASRSPQRELGDLTRVITLDSSRSGRIASDAHALHDIRSASGVVGAIRSYHYEKRPAACTNPRGDLEALAAWQLTP